MTIETKRKRLLQKIAAEVKKQNKSSHKISRELNAPTRNGIENVLSGKNCNVDTLLFVMDSLGLELTIKN